MWHVRALTEVIADALKAEEQRLVTEQAVHGMDARDELALHPVLAAGLIAAGFGVSRELEYPHEWKKKKRRERVEEPERIDMLTGEVLPPEPISSDDTLPQWRERQRCDLVLTLEPGARVGDPVVAVKKKRAVRAEGAGTLFEPAAIAAADALPDVPVGTVPPEDAFWLEIKLVCQFSNVSHDGGMGVPGPNPSYASQLVRGITTDLRKLATDGRIQQAGVALLLFTADEATAEHDLLALLHKCLDKGLPIQSPTTERISVVDRIGNRYCTVALIPIRG